MKRMILTAVLALAMTGVICAQNYMVVNSEKIFKSIEAYNTAIAQLDKQAETYQKQVDAKFKEVETLYNNYMAKKMSLSESARQSVESTILTREQEATRFQESLFGTDGTLMKKRIELIQPIQQRVFKAIEEYASANGFEMVIDIATNPNVLYYSQNVDRTQAVIDAVKNTK